ncbi:hypothetical protein SAMN04487936_10920 [Halobacillus dabanensis]|uniref:Uncharacterized protein n=1 Tax=Halobacillus dabanensis TaxID=240302 RepID=A0A1I3XLP0_HALDA|nr:hypothetical protein [Halobacillus dabanensis]SFK20442.1 hypothetical protein SAMN04487936_10920 [Halobacillus dabanensis]
MYPIYYGIVIIVSIAALLSTIVIAKGVSKQDNTISAEDDIKKLKSDENRSNSIPLLTTIYSITFAITIILVGIFIF